MPTHTYVVFMNKNMYEHLSVWLSEHSFMFPINFFKKLFNTDEIYVVIEQRCEKYYSYHVALLTL